MAALTEPAPEKEAGTLEASDAEERRTCAVSMFTGEADRGVSA
ncbi:hypothetical protein ACFFX0_06285 [Citricoccus parietis]|uniref:Uncharacterized protein n=1 Tax=Citricoccus parietis TaxID=592307 RepID=A0ABV5FVZ7_9MICC